MIRVYFYLISTTNLGPLLAIHDLAVKLVARHFKVGLHLLDRYVQVVFDIR